LVHEESWTSGLEGLGWAQVKKIEEMS
jgi:hypothetical protein